MRLISAIEAYVELKRSMGAVFSVDARILRSLGRTFGDVPLESISVEACHRFCRGKGPPSRFWERKHQALRGFFRFLVSRGHLTSSPLPEPPPRIERTFLPYIFSHVEIRQLLEAAAAVHFPRSPMQPATLRILLLTIYAAGLRAGEALRLRCCDVDLPEQLLTIWDTKFFKSRLVPIGASLSEALCQYREHRQGLPMPAGVRSRFFATRQGQAVSLGSLEKAFARLREQVGIRRPLAERWQPRLHDLRHSFTHHRLVAWYREGADVQARLPLLATYLGHENLSGTQAYLTMTSELLTEASLRFERYASVDETAR